MQRFNDFTPAARTPHGRLPLDPRAHTHRCSLSLPKDLPLGKWKDVGEQISAISDSSAWWLGDWLVYGQDRFPDRYRKAIEETSLDYQTLRNYAWIARKFPASRRHSELSLQHHGEVASMPAEEQDCWLNRAKEFGWSRNELRRRLRAAKAGLPAPGECEQQTLQVNASPEQQERWQDAAQEANTCLEEWIIKKVDEAADTRPRIQCALTFLYSWLPFLPSFTVA